MCPIRFSVASSDLKDHRYRTAPAPIVANPIQQRNKESLHKATAGLGERVAGTFDIDNHTIAARNHVFAMNLAAISLFLA